MSLVRGEPSYCMNVCSKILDGLLLHIPVIDQIRSTLFHFWRTSMEGTRGPRKGTRGKMCKHSYHLGQGGISPHSCPHRVKTVHGWCYLSIRGGGRYIYDHRSYDQMSLLNAMNVAFQDILYLWKIARDGSGIQRGFFPSVRQDRI